MSVFKKASKEKSKLRLALFGPSGAGKTYTSLSIAKGLGGKVALIDTERGSASKYADRFDFDTVDLEKKTISEYCDMITQARGYDVLVIDSLSHGWQELLTEIDKLAKTKYKGNTWSAWSEGTPEQKRLVDAILSFPGHIIATMRSKTEWTTEKDERSGKSKPIRVGLTPEQGKGIEYEFDLLIELSTEHFGSVLKDRTGKYQDEIFEKPGEDLGKELAKWLNKGVNPPPKFLGESKEHQEQLKAAAQASGWSEDDVKSTLAAKGISDPAQLEIARVQGLIDFISDNKRKAKPAVAAPKTAAKVQPKTESKEPTPEQAASDAFDYAGGDHPDAAASQADKDDFDEFLK